MNHEKTETTRSYILPISPPTRGQAPTGTLPILVISATRGGHTRNTYWIRISLSGNTVEKNNPFSATFAVSFSLRRE